MCQDTNSMSGTEMHNQFVVTFYKPGGETSDDTRNFDNYNEAATFAWRMQNDPDVTRVIFRSRRVRYTPWKVYTITEPDHY